MQPDQTLPPSEEELRSYVLGKCDPQRAAEIDAYLERGPDCSKTLGSAPEDDVVRHLRGAGELPRMDTSPQSASFGTRHDAAVSASKPDSETELGADGAALREHPRYRLIRKLGEGGMGAVYLAEHRLMGRLVAIKLIRAGYLGDPKLVARFRQEVQAAAQLAHPNIVTAHDADEIAGTHFLVMEYIEGELLDRLLARKGPLPVQEACDCVRQAALGLAFAHGRGMIHRDVKPHNLMKMPNGTVKVLDFGLARLFGETARLDPPVTAEGTIMGTADYMAPEQASDSRLADIRADVYSLGCTLYHLLAGRVPFPGGTATDKIVKHATAQPEPLRQCRSDASPKLVRVAEKMMAKEAKERYQTPSEVAAALEPFTRQSGTGSSTTLSGPPSDSLPIRSRPRRRMYALGLAALILTAGAIVTAIVLNRTPNQVQPRLDDAVLVEPPRPWLLGKLDKIDGKGFHIAFDDGDRAVVDPSRVAANRIPKKEDVEVGTRVLAKFRKGDFYPGKIAFVRANQPYEIKFDDGDTDIVDRAELRLLENQVRPGDAVLAESIRPWLHGKVAKIDGEDFHIEFVRNERVVDSSLVTADRALKKEDVEVGSRVLAKYGNGPFFPGKIASIEANKEYVIDFDDGDTGKVTLAELRLFANRPNLGEAVLTESSPPWLSMKVVKIVVKDIHIQDRGQRVVDASRIAADFVPKKENLKVDTRVLAKFWDGRFYAGTISSIESDHFYVIRFDDGDADRVTLAKLRLITYQPRPDETVLAELIPVWSPGKVAKIDGKGFHIKFGRGDRVVAVSKICVDRPPRKESLKIGTRVLAKFRTGPFFPGKIISVEPNQEYDIQLDDGYNVTVTLDELRLIAK